MVAKPVKGQSAASQVMPTRERNVSSVRESETAPTLGEIVRRIMILESSGGRKNYSKCQAIGKYNRYGYSIPGNGTYKCFEKDEDTKAVLAWFQDKLKTHNLKEALCVYNRGIKTEECGYVQKFLAI